MNHTRAQAPFDTDRTYTFMRGALTALNYPDALTALTFMDKCHAGQYRKSGLPYIIHPLTLACHAIALGIRDETVLAACLLHDVVEDCGVLVTELPVQSDDIKHTVSLLTHNKADSLDVYYQRIAASPAASLVKLLDRCDNVSTMSGVFSMEKLEDYINETRTYVMPLYRVCKDAYPAWSSQLFVLKYHITSIIDSLDAMLPVSDGATEPAPATTPAPAPEIKPDDPSSLPDNAKLFVTSGMLDASHCTFVVRAESFAEVRRKLESEGLKAYSEQCNIQQADNPSVISGRPVRLFF